MYFQESDLECEQGEGGVEALRLEHDGAVLLVLVLVQLLLRLARPPRVSPLFPEVAFINDVRSGWGTKGGVPKGR